MRDRFTVGIDRCTDGRAVKQFGSHAAAEFEKARAVEVALEGTPFLVPRALCCDAASGRIEFEFLEGAILLQEILEQAYDTRQFRRVLKLNDAAARLVGLLHRELVVPNARRWKAPLFLLRHASQIGYSLEADDVYLHCDYSPVNLLVDGDDRMAVIDASPNTYFTDYACLKGPCYIDVATYTARLAWPYRLRSYSIAWRKLAGTLRRRFVDIYERTTARELDPAVLRMFESAVARCFVEWKTSNPLARAAARIVQGVGMHRTQ